MIKIPCTNCGSVNTRAIDTEVLAVNSVEDIKGGAASFDNEAYMTGRCDDCGENFQQVFDLTPRLVGKQKLKVELIDIVLDTIESDINKGDKTAVEELLNFCPIENLIAYLPEELWKKFDYLKK